MLLLAAAVAAPVPASAQKPASPVPPTPGTGILDGVVRDSAGHPLAGASVTVLATDGVALSDSAGYFHLERLPPDTLTFAVRRVGYAPAVFELAVPPNMRVSLAVKMQPNAQRLETVVINGERRDLQLHHDGFYDRKRNGIGYFLDPEFLARHPTSVHPTTLLREVPSVRIACKAGNIRCVPYLGRGTEQCVPPVWVDGVRQTVLDDFDSIVSTEDIKAIEVYASRFTVPMKFMGTMPDRDCGAIVVWTKWTH
jgi:CarboxypepD_reg-like domain